MVGQRDRALVEPGRRVGRRVPPVRDRDQPEVLAGRPVVVHVAPGDHRHGGGGDGEPHRVVPAVVDPARGRRRHRAPGHLAEPAAGTLVQRPVAHHHLRGPGGDGHRRLVHTAAGRAAAVADLAEERQLADAELPRERDLGHGVHGERDQAVHVGRPQPGVRQRGRRGLGGQAQLAAARVLGELGGPDPGDRRRPGDHAVLPGAVDVPEGSLERPFRYIHEASPAGNATRTVPVT